MTTENETQKLSCKLAQLATNFRYRWNQDSDLERIDPTKSTVILGNVVSAMPHDPFSYRRIVYGEVCKLPWSTYRRDFPALHASHKTYTSDVGWGCSIRVCQMLLLETLSRHLRVPWSENPFLLANFISEGSSNGVFSLQKFIDTGERCLGKFAGDWFSPVDVSHILCLLLAENFLVENLRVYVATDSCVCISEILADMTGLSSEDFACHCESTPDTCPLCSGFLWQGSLLLLVPIMPGQKKVQQKYFHALKFFLSLKESVGIIGAKQCSALYFIGFQEDCLLFLDPHYVQKCALDDDDLQTLLSTYQSPTVGCLPLSKLGSSMSLGFYFDSYAAFSAFISLVEGSSEKQEELIHFQKTRTHKTADIEFVD